MGGIKEALKKINVDYVAAGVKESSADVGALEFEFGESQEPAGLVFEGADVVAAVPETPASATHTPPTEKTVSAPKEEFSIPESFEVNEKYNTPASENEKTKIWTTYVPRFTEVSDNYRMVNDPRPRTETPVEVKAVVEEAKSKIDEADPTAEYEAESDNGAVKVYSTGKVDIEDFSESLNVFKFAAGNVEPEARSEEVAVAASAEVPEPTEETVDQPVAAQPADQIQEPTPTEPEAPKPKPVITDIPDPTSSDIQIVDYSDAKSGAGALDTYVAQPAPLTPDSSEKRSGEYTAFYQRDSFKDKFLDVLLSSKIRFVAAIFIAVVLLAFENIGYLGVKITEMLRLTSTPWAVSLIDLQLSLCVMLLALPEIVDAFKQLKLKVFSPELLLLPSFAVVVACGAVNIVTNDRTPIFVGTVFAIHAIVAIFADSTRKTADFSAFKATSLNGEKKIIDVAPTKTLPAENRALDGAVDSYKSGTVRIFRASFLSDFFKRTSKRRENTFNSVLTLAISLGVAIVCGLVCYFVFGGLDFAAPAFASVYLVSVPAVAMLVHKLPYHHAQRVCIADSSVIVGESALYDFEDADVITFDDTEIFGNEDVVLKRFMLYGDRENMTKAMRQMSSLFAVTGGPLDNIFSKALEKRTAPATGAIIEDEGVSGYVDGKHVMAGSFDYMSRHGIEVHSDGKNTENGADTTRIMYAAEDGVVYAKFYIRYSFSEEFSAILPSLRERKIVPLIYTRDPNISNELLKALTAGQGTMRVLKRYDTPEEDTQSLLRASAGIVTFGDKMNAIRTVLLSKKYSALQKKLSLAEIIAMSVGCATAVILSILRINVPSAFYALWQAAACIALGVAVKRIFAVNKNDKENEEN